MKPIRVILTEKEKNLILENTFAPDYLVFRLKEAEVKGKYFKVDYSYDELDELAGFIAAEFNHTIDEKIRRDLDKLSDKINLIIEDEY
ncbi:MAG: hypothetical protein RBR53_00880 [Desulforegulaceae bacterium]|nr:hypothetical protein [Desulforegulaceae bacterium]